MELSEKQRKHLRDEVKTILAIARIQAEKTSLPSKQTRKSTLRTIDNVETILMPYITTWLDVIERPHKLEVEHVIVDDGKGGLFYYHCPCCSLHCISSKVMRSHIIAAHHDSLHPKTEVVFAEDCVDEPMTVYPRAIAEIKQ